ncbi:BglG family transcription antiterminator LicT [Streptococcus caprae]|uniref:BglG family transcription antiterminator LicT n=1 Tax=Streptococcus caprae TaxID=1640501 RepID=A0ABV8CVF3_9STRE
MKVEKVYNNNVVQVRDDSDHELIVMGRGLGFQKKTGDFLDETLIEKRFVLEGKEEAQAFGQIYGDLDGQEITLVMDMIHEAEEVLGETFDTNFYMSFADHIHYTIERVRSGFQIQNPLFWEVRKFYPQEFELGKTFVSRLEQAYTLHLGEEEAASIALHFINAQKESKSGEKNLKMAKIVQELLDIVRLHFGAQLDESDIAYTRFVTHVQYFAQRIVNGMIQGNNDAFLYEQVQNNYPKAFACCQKINQLVEAAYEFPMSLDEQVYLTIHIQRLQVKQAQ